MIHNDTDTNDFNLWLNGLSILTFPWILAVLVVLVPWIGFVRQRNCVARQVGALATVGWEHHDLDWSPDWSPSSLPLPILQWENQRQTLPDLRHDRMTRHFLEHPEPILSPSGAHPEPTLSPSSSSESEAQLNSETRSWPPKSTSA